MTDLETQLRALFHDPAVLQHRLELLRRWRSAGLHGDLTIAHAAGQAASEAGSVRISIASSPGTVELTLAEVWERATIAAGGLRRLGVRAGERVAVQLPNSPEALVTYLAVNVLGGVLVPIVQIYGPSDTRRILEAAGASTFIVAPRAGRDGSLSWLSEGDGAGVERVVVVGDGRPPGAESWSSLEGGDDPVLEPTGAGDDVSVLLYTSGTTNAPKGVLHTNNSILALLQVMPCPSFGFEGTFLWSWPSGHIGGILAALSPFLRRLDTVLLGETWDTDLLLDVLEQRHVTGMSGVTTVALRVLEAVEQSERRLPLREFFSGGAAIPPSLVERAATQGWHFTRCFGMTENPVATATTASDPLDLRRTSEGRPVREGHVRIVRDDGSDCGPLEDGEILLVSPQQMLGYDDPALNAEAFTADGWLRTGDIGRVTEAGHLTVTDRKKDIVIRGGENISSQEVEEALSTMPQVRESAVVAMPDPELGERACAFVLLHPGDAVDLDDVRAHFAALGLARQKCPERLIVEDELPRTSTGKVQKEVLRARLRAEASTGQA